MRDLFATLDSTRLLEGLGILSLLTFVCSLLLVPWLILRLPTNYFIRHRLELGERRRLHPLWSGFLFFLRNCIGLMLLAAGLAMLILPGQGILTLVIGLGLMDFPGKQRLQDRVVQNSKVQQSLNWIRKRGNREELIFPVVREEN